MQFPPKTSSLSINTLPPLKSLYLFSPFQSSLPPSPRTLTPSLSSNPSLFRSLSHPPTHSTHKVSDNKIGFSHLLVRLCAVIGGAFALTGLLDKIVFNVVGLLSGQQGFRNGGDGRYGSSGQGMDRMHTYFILLYYICAYDDPIRKYMCLESVVNGTERNGTVYAKMD